jgi:hypothetical protein
MSNQTWKCKNFHLACLLRFALGDAAHLYTEQTPSGPVFMFSEVAKCRELSDLFYADAEPIAIGDLKAFIAVLKSIRTSINKANESEEGLWANEVI